MVVTANQYFGLRPGSLPTWDAWKARFLLRHMLRHGVQQQGVSSDPPLPAFVGAGKWKVLCSNPTCRGAELVWEEGLMLCASCLNDHVAHQFLRTVFPKERVAIEQLLELRPLSNRNWLPHESLDELRAENQTHGLGVS